MSASESSLRWSKAISDGGVSNESQDSILERGAVFGLGVVDEEETNRDAGDVPVAMGEGLSHTGKPSARLNKEQVSPASGRAGEQDGLETSVGSVCKVGEV